MSTLLLRLAGPLQSWGTLDKFGIRTTDTEPSKSGVVGLLCAAMGVPRADATTIRKLGELAMGVRADREGEVLRDYHTVGGGKFAGQPHGVYDAKLKRGVHTVPTTRDYLSDAVFLVALEGDPVLLERAREGLVSPCWHVSLGRRACVPSGPLFVSLEATPLGECLRTWPRNERALSGPLRLILESTADEGRPRDDVPLSFEPRAFGRRYITIASVDPPPARMAS